MMNTNEGIIINNIYFNLTQLEKDCWNRLVNGAVKSKDAFHAPCVGSISNGEVSMRTMVLRKALPIEKVLRFHTDIRSRKWNELALNNSISALFYDSAARIQLRVKGKAVLHFDSAITAEAWQKTALSGRRSYLTTNSPSSFSDIPTSGLAEKVEQENFTVEESEVGQQNFGIVDVQVESIDWLWLHHAGHRRAFFDYVIGDFRWMVP
ncbi:hypothetical protein [Sediminibacterium sp.]|uniref:hypothetical protein n=1 Tax=Sediminibacterium sp. TaxID=1917865 RepID=UPI003F728327